MIIRIQATALIMLLSMVPVFDADSRSAGTAISTQGVAAEWEPQESIWLQ